MRKKTITLYKFNELSNEAKERAYSEYMENGRFEYIWMDENIDSVKAFSNLFGIKVKDYQLGTSCQSFIITDAIQDDFRGVKPSDIPSGDCPFTGYYLDDVLLLAFHHHVEKNNGDVKGAFEYAIDAALKDIVSDMEYQESFEYFKDCAFNNGLEFLENGEVYR